MSMQITHTLQNIPGIDVLGFGYDVFGDYASGSSTTFALFDLGKTDEFRTDPTHTYAKPKSVTYTPLLGGTFERFTGRTLEQYSQSLNSVTQISGRYNFFSGSLSVDFDVHRFRSSQYEYSHITDVINAWSLRLPEPSSLPAMLKRTVRNDLDDPQLEPTRLFDRYGTHYLWEAVVGARAVFSSTTDTLTYRSDFSLELVAELAYENLVGSIRGHQEVQYKQSIESFTQSSETRVTTLGGRPELARAIATGSYDQWTKSVHDNPVFVDFTSDSLRPIWELCSDAKRRRALQEAFGPYASKREFRPPAVLPLRTGDVLAFRRVAEADPGNHYIPPYLSVFGQRDGSFPIWAAKDSIDPFSQFVVEVLDDQAGQQTVALRRLTEKDPLNRFIPPYLSVIGEDGAYPVKAAKPAIDDFCKFIVEKIDDNRIALRCVAAQTVNPRIPPYLGLIGTRAGTDSFRFALMASKESSDDPYAQFTLEIIVK